MKLKLLAIGLTAAGLVASAQTASAIPATANGSVAATQGVALAHYSARKHIHKGDRIEWRSEKRDMSSGRSVSKSHRGSSSKSKSNMNNTQPPSSQQQQQQQPQPQGGSSY